MKLNKRILFILNTYIQIIQNTAAIICNSSMIKEDDASDMSKQIGAVSLHQTGFINRKDRD